MIRTIVPKAKATIVDGLAAAMPDMTARFQINTQLRQAHFLAQLAHESAGMTTTVEFASGAAYEGRRDLGNTQRGDGMRFKGRGLIQLTGRANYARFGKLLGTDLVSNPESAAAFPWAALTSGEYWNDRKINSAADRDDLVGVTKKINGGTNGLSSRRSFLALAKQALRNTPGGARATVVTTDFSTLMNDWGFGVLFGFLGSVIIAATIMFIVHRVRKHKEAQQEETMSEPLLRTSEKGVWAQLTPNQSRRHKSVATGIPSSPGVSARNVHIK